MLTVIWKLVEKLLVPAPKQLKSPTVETQGLKWSFAAGTNLLSQLGAKIERQSKQKLNEFARELRSFPSIDMSGRNFGDEGLFFLAESLAFNQTGHLFQWRSGGSEASLGEHLNLTDLVRPAGSVSEGRARSERRMMAIESTVEELKAEMRAMTHEFQRAFGRRSRNQDRSSKGSHGSVNAEPERRPPESSEDESEDDRGDRSWMKCVELPTFEGTDPIGWIAKVEKFFDIQSVTEKEKMKLASKCTPFETVYERPPPTLTCFIPGETVVEAIAQDLQTRDEALKQLRYHLARA
ncbi:hypothetical protein V8G54_030599 [Vigna mungo]|uniref:Retrotransposon gag domain-containing protein n=1 Tax=Vigna mungo TaxID=3915 RepID=A0AAQ3RK85_VIGMU